ncbi:MAG: ATP-dependent helicase [Bacteroidetes bacterium]|nr:ATP-dependent helicase [Bacteroidota bacterium]
MIFNKAQTEALEAIEGPLMVIAGPGTGKTRILTNRVLSIIEKTGLNPENILCLTYTDAAASEMRKRLIELMGSAAHRVEISTFHAFCQKVITEYQNELNVQNLEPISKLEQVLYYNSIFDALDDDNPLKNYKFPYKERNNLIKLNNYLKKENIDRNTIYNISEKYLENLKTDEKMFFKKKSGENNKGDFKENAFKKEELKVNKLKAATDLCYQYREMLENNGRYEIDDMIIWVINLFKSNSEILLNYQEKYQYIMVDEFQDNNKTQFELTLLLASYWDSPNLMIVGDDDQSIFKFQGANLENLIDFENKFTNTLNKVILNENYRSSQQILNAAALLIKNNKTRLLNEKNLIEKSNFIKKDANISIIECTNKYYEAAFVTSEIERLYKTGIGYGEMAVIYRKNKESELFQKILAKKNIPFYLKKKVNIFSVDIVKNIIKILNYISLEHIRPYSGQHFLFEILHFDFWSINSSDNAKLAYYISTNKILWRDCLNNINHNKEIEQMITAESIEKINTLAKELEFWITQSFNIPVIRLAEKIISGGGLLSYILKSENKKFLLEALNTFFNLLKDVFHKNPQYSLIDFLNLLNTIENEKIEIETNEIFEKKDAVSLTTAHSSKGLEFEAVFITGCNYEIWDKEDKERNFLGLRDILGFDDQTSTIEENRRLFYVACTRAKSYLYLSYNNFETEKNQKGLSQSGFISELNHFKDIPNIKFEDNNDDVTNTLIANLTYNISETGFKTLEPELLNTFTENYVLSATHLDDYLQCPVMFYYKYVLNLPVVPSIYLVFGNSVHKALEMFFDAMLQNSAKQYPDATFFIKIFKNEMNKNREYLTSKEYENFTKLGEMLFPKLYIAFIDEWNANKNIVTESYIRNVVVNNVPIKGKIDLMQFFDKNSVKVVDFKTGKFTKEKLKYLEPPLLDNIDKNGNNTNMYGGKYWRQIAFYYLLTNFDKTNNYNVAEGEVIFVEPKENGDFERNKIFINNEQISFMEKLISDVYNNIKSQKFNEGCGEKDCEWCNFNKYYIEKSQNKTISLTDENEV